ncbi:MAG: restriction endonuclease subunit R [Candidatus Margulisiibacteriota bacterium]|nr:MAG: restriction endonuclease subunit R [Candidatus Margulisiibacteriota bacterium]HCY37611.1 restriction endonuclease subunit R [Candidatus Margulisiibacteriota bacterium]
MTNRILFQFDDKLDYQLKAVNSIVELFRGLPKIPTTSIYKNIRKKYKWTAGDPVRNLDITEGSKLLENLRSVQLTNNLFADSEIQNNNFTIEMETGTGKTYVYLRTILELNREYGFNKFIIVVPSIPIRMGVEKTIDMLKEHFKALYDIDLKKHSFVYDSNNPQKVSTGFVETKELSICVMNIHAFNKDTNKIRQEDEYGQVLWEDIKYVRPIIIIDEPQKIEGTAKKKSASLQAIEVINPLFTLRYSATHKQLFNQVYKLDSFDAFQMDLVKKIEVKTVHGIIPKDSPYIRYVSFTKELKARIEIFCQEQGSSIKFKTFDVRGGTPLFELSGKLVQYRDIRIQEDPHKLKPLKIAYKDDIKEIALGQSTNEFTHNEAVKIQIQLAIINHLDKQFKILAKGERIKVLSLFFIDEVAKVRDNTQPDGRGEYFRIFDEEYKKFISDPKYKKEFEKYSDLFKSYTDIQNVREGYFAIDKNKTAVDIEGWDSSIDDNKVKAKSQEDIDRGIDLILKKKDELISFDEPLAFIFSHSALREGWDNPNVFTLCTLKSGGSEIAKKQEIGRGLRLPVDVTGNRCTDSEVNELTVIANDYYEQFADNLQRDFNDSMNFNKDEVTADIIISTLKSAGIPKIKITPALVDAFKNELFYGGVVSTSNTLTNAAESIKYLNFKDETLQEHSEMIKENFIKYMVQKGTHKITIKNGDNDPITNSVHNYVAEEDFVKLFKSLSEKLCKRSIYKFDLNKDKFIEECSNELNEYLKFMRVKNEYEIESGKAGFDETQKFKMADAAIKVIDNISEDFIEQKSDLEIVNYIMHHTMLPRFAILKIIWRLEKRELLNNQDILDAITGEILNKLNNAKAQNLYAYEVIEGYELETGKIFEADTIDEELFNREKAVYITNAANRRAINKYYRMDSEGEYSFAEKLEQNKNVLLFTKLKKGGFVIDTPYGNYSPDWAIVYKKDNGNIKLYLIVETKFAKQIENLTSVEKLKIKCGKRHFEAVTKEAQFDWVNSYDDFRRKFGVVDTL